MNCRRRERSGSSSIKIIVESAVETDEPDTRTSGCVAALQRLATGRQGAFRAFHVPPNSAIEIALSATVSVVSGGGPRRTPVRSAAEMAAPACAQRTMSATIGIAMTANNTTKTTVRIVFMDGIIHEAAISASAKLGRGANFRERPARSNPAARPLTGNSARSRRTLPLSVAPARQAVRLKCSIEFQIRLHFAAAGHLAQTFWPPRDRHSRGCCSRASAS